MKKSYGLIMNNFLGQHFLKNKSVLRTIAEALDIHAGDTVIEIGPGHGELTDYLLASPAEKIIAIEKDEALAQALRKRVSSARFNIVTGDALTELPNIALSPTSHPYTLTGSIPYYITGHLFRTIGKLEHKPTRIVFTIQKEVAERVCALPPRMNRLAATVRIWGEPEIIAILKPGNFNPPPAVDSAIIILGVRDKGLESSELENYYRTVRALFAQPRKTIINNLTAEFPNIPKEKLLGLLADQNINPAARPQNLSIEKIKMISLKR